MITAAIVHMGRY